MRITRQGSLTPIQFTLNSLLNLAKNFTFFLRVALQTILNSFFLLWIMYSSEIESLFKQNHASVGDSIELFKGKEKFVGTIMPRPDIGDAGILVLKQQNGYNIGIKIDGSAKITKLESHRT